MKIVGVDATAPAADLAVAAGVKATPAMIGVGQGIYTRPVTGDGAVITDQRLLHHTLAPPADIAASTGSVAGPTMVGVLVEIDALIPAEGEIKGAVHLAGGVVIAGQSCIYAGSLNELTIPVDAGPVGGAIAVDLAAHIA